MRRAFRALLALSLAAPWPAAAQLRAVPRVAAPVAPAFAPRLAAPSLAPLPSSSLLPAASLTPTASVAPAPSVLERLGAAADAPRPADPVPGAAVPRSLASIKTLRIGTYNVLNLFQKVGKHERRADGSFEQVSGPVDKEEASREAQARVIREEGLDVVVLEEVENIAALEQFNQEHLGGQYRAFLIEGNDERGIDIAFLVKKDLPFEVEQRSRKGETWQDPALGGRTVPLFSRDLTSLVLRAPGRAQPLAVLFGTHMKSKRDRPGDPESGIQRAAQAKRTAEILAETREEFGPGVPLLVAGDFNGDLMHGPELRPLFELAGLVDGFDAAPEKTAPQDRVSHTYHPRDGAAQAHQMDGVLIDKAWSKLVQRTRAYRYKDEQGREKPVPHTYAERSLNPSDHFPVILDLDFAGLLKAQDEGEARGRDMADAQALQLALLRPLAAKLGLDVTSVSLLSAAIGHGVTLRDLLDGVQGLRNLRATPQEAEYYLGEAVKRHRLELGPDGKPTRDGLENLFLQHSDGASAVEIGRNGFFLETERAAAAARQVWSLDLSEASWSLHEGRVAVRFGTARLGSLSRVLGVTLDPRFTQAKPSVRVAAVADWPGLSPESRAAVRRVAAELAAAGY